MLLIRPDAAHRVTVLGSTRKRAATSPGVSRRSLLSSTLFASHALPVMPVPVVPSVPANGGFDPDFRKIAICVVSGQLSPTNANAGTIALAWYLGWVRG